MTDDIPLYGAAYWLKLDERDIPVVMLGRQLDGKFLVRDRHNSRFEARAETLTERQAR